METTVSTKGQVVIPRAIRERLGLEPGTRLEVEDRGESIVLRRLDARKRYTVDDIMALPRYYQGPPVSDSEIHDRLDADLRRRWEGT